ncbi:MAG: NADH:flavin oxidoreductase, partial [Chthoniobacterales bacterium]
MSKLKPARLATLKTLEDFRKVVETLGIDLQASEFPPANGKSVLAQPATANGKVIGNRWAIHPMEGWD